MGGNGIRALVGVVVYLVIIVFLLFGILANSATSVPSTENVKAVRFSGKDVNLFHASKRKVPNGPDPIHNRKAKTSRRPTRTLGDLRNLSICVSTSRRYILLRVQSILSDSDLG